VVRCGHVTQLTGQFEMLNGARVIGLVAWLLETSDDKRLYMNACVIAIQRKLHALMSRCQDRVLVELPNGSLSSSSGLLSASHGSSPGFWIGRIR